MATGCVSCDEFRRNIDEFLKLSVQLKDGWLKETFEVPRDEEKNVHSPAAAAEARIQDSSHHVIPYVIKRNVLRQSGASQKKVISNTDLKSSTTESTEDKVLEDEAVLEGDDLTNTLAEETLQAPSAEVHQYEYHILYSSSYTVPVLYFTACKSDGKLLSLDEVWRAVPEYYQTRLKHQRWTFITQQEHPYLGRPFFQLHPCHTADLMYSVLPKGSKSVSRGNYVVTWLSSVGPVVGLSLPLAYSQLCNKDR